MHALLLVWFAIAPVAVLKPSIDKYYCTQACNHRYDRKRPERHRDCLAQCAKTKPPAKNKPASKNDPAAKKKK